MIRDFIAWRVLVPLARVIALCGQRSAGYLRLLAWRLAP